MGKDKPVQGFWICIADSSVVQYRKVVMVQYNKRTSDWMKQTRQVNKKIKEIGRKPGSKNKPKPVQPQQPEGNKPAEPSQPQNGASNKKQKIFIKKFNPEDYQQVKNRINELNKANQAITQGHEALKVKHGEHATTLSSLISTMDKALNTIQEVNERNKELEGKHLTATDFTNAELMRMTNRLNAFDTELKLEINESKYQRALNKHNDNMQGVFLIMTGICTVAIGAIALEAGIDFINAFPFSITIGALLGWLISRLEDVENYPRKHFYNIR
jgi:hypothetical protein